MAEIVWTLEAAQWLEEIYQYIASESASSAHKVVTGIYDKIQLLRRHPRLGLGYQLREQAYLLRHFDRVVDREMQSPAPVSRELIEAYLRTLAHLQPITRRLRLSTIRQFLLYLRQFEPATYIPDRFARARPLVTSSAVHLYRG